MSHGIFVVSGAEVHELFKAIGVSSRCSSEKLDAAKAEMLNNAHFSLDLAALPALDLREAERAWRALRDAAAEPKPKKATVKGYRSPGQSAPVRRRSKK